MTSVRPVLCRACKHLKAGGKCAAFPKGIPEAISMDGEDHRDKRKGDHGVTFELKSGKDKEFEQWKRVHDA